MERSTLGSIDVPTNNNALVAVRKRQWMYLGPILAAPLAHLGVSLYRTARTKMQRQVIMGAGIIGSTALTVGMRLFLMYHAGLPGIELDEKTANQRIQRVTRAERHSIERPSSITVIREAIKGFG